MTIPSSNTVLDVLNNELLSNDIDAWHSNDSYISQEKCIHFVEQNPDPTNSVPAITIFMAIYAFVFVLGLLGNLGIVVVTLAHRHMRSVQNIFILNLAISDVIVCLLCLPFTLVANIYKEWLFGQPICHLLPFVQALSVFVSTFSLSVIAIDRFILVVRPHARQAMSLQMAVILAAVLWAISVIVSFPYAYYMQLEEYPGYCGQFCSEQWPTGEYRRGYTLVVLSLQFLIPFATMSFCYASIFSKLRQRANVKLRRLEERSKALAGQRTSSPIGAANGIAKIVLNGTTAMHSKCALPTPLPTERVSMLVTSNGCSNGMPPENASLRANALNKQQRRSATILASMVLFFGLAWLPQNIVTLLIEYDDTMFLSSNVNYTYLVSMIAHSIAMTTNVANPILYAWLNPNFKELFLRTLRRNKFRCTAATEESKVDLAGQNTIVQVNGLKGRRDDF